MKWLGVDKATIIFLYFYYKSEIKFNRSGWIIMMCVFCVQGIYFSWQQFVELFTSKMDKDIFCTLCRNNVSMTESEFDEHMRAVHDVTTHLDILLALNFVTKL